MTKTLDTNFIDLLERYGQVHSHTTFEVVQVHQIPGRQTWTEFIRFGTHNTLSNLNDRVQFRAYSFCYGEMRRRLIICVP